MNILIVDDEKLARDRIKRFLKDRNEEVTVSEAANGVEAIEQIKTKKFELVFLDIQMPEVSGLDVLAQVEDRNFQIIFQTAFDEYAVKAFEENACDYLLKPYDAERFNKAVSKAMKQLNKPQNFDSIELAIKREKKYLDCLVVKSGMRSILIKVDKILAFTSKDHYTFIHTESSEHIFDLSLSHLEGRLDPEQFMRCHRNTIVSRKAIKNIIGGDNMSLELQNGVRFNVSRNNRTEIKTWLTS